MTVARATRPASSEAGTSTRRRCASPCPPPSQTGSAWPARTCRPQPDPPRPRSLDARHLGALDIRGNHSGGQLQHVLAGRGLVQGTQRQGARTLVDTDPLVLRPVALEHVVPLVLAPRRDHRGARASSRRAKASTLSRLIASTRSNSAPRIAVRNA